MEIPFRYRRSSVPFYSLLISLTMTGVISCFIIYYSSQSSYNAIGEMFVDSEFPSPSFSPFYLKPMTWLMIFIITGWVSFIELAKNRIRLLGPNSRFIYMLFLFLITSLTLYEVVYNFMLWGAILASQGVDEANPDITVNHFPDEKYQVNLVFATKVGVTILVCGVYALTVFRDKP